MLGLMKRIPQLFRSRRRPIAEIDDVVPFPWISGQVTMPMFGIERDNLTVPTATPNPDDTQPRRPSRFGEKLSSDETNPRRPTALDQIDARLPEPSDAPLPDYGIPGDPYAGLFPPPAPDDDAFLETGLPPPDQPTPTEGDTPVNFTGAGRPPLQPPANQPL